MDSSISTHVAARGAVCWFALGRLAGSATWGLGRRKAAGGTMGPRCVRWGTVCPLGHRVSTGAPCVCWSTVFLLGHRVTTRNRWGTACPLGHRMATGYRVSRCLHEPINTSKLQLHSDKTWKDETYPSKMSTTRMQNGA